MQIKPGAKIGERGVDGDKHFVLSWHRWLGFETQLAGKSKALALIPKRTAFLIEQLHGLEIASNSSPPRASFVHISFSMPWRYAVKTLHASKASRGTGVRDVKAGDELADVDGPSGNTQRSSQLWHVVLPALMIDSCLRPPSTKWIDNAA